MQEHDPHIWSHVDLKHEPQVNCQWVTGAFTQAPNSLQQSYVVRGKSSRYLLVFRSSNNDPSQVTAQVEWLQSLCGWAVRSMCLIYSKFVRTVTWEVLTWGKFCVYLYSCLQNRFGWFWLEETPMWWSLHVLKFLQSLCSHIYSEVITVALNIYDWSFCVWFDSHCMQTIRNLIVCVEFMCHVFNHFTMFYFSENCSII